MCECLPSTKSLLVDVVIYPEPLFSRKHLHGNDMGQYSLSYSLYFPYIRLFYVSATFRSLELQQVRQFRRSFTTPWRTCRSSCLLRGVASEGDSNIYFVQSVVYNNRKTSHIRRTLSPNLNVSGLVSQLSLPNPLKPDVKSLMKI